MIVLPLTGGVEVTIGETTFRLAGRESVFTGVTDTAYLPIDSHGPAEQCRWRHDRAARLPGRPGAAVPVPAGVRGGRGVARQRICDPAGEQLRDGHGHGVREDARHRGADPGFQLVVLPAAQARREQRRRRPNWRRSTTTCSPPRPRPATSAHAMPNPLAINGSTAPTSARSRCWRRSPTGTPCWFRTAGTGRASPRRRITCTT